MAVASSLPQAQIDAALDAAGLGQFVSVRISGHDDVPPDRGKPAPDVYRAAAAALRLDPRDCAALEDSSTGLASARGAGCYVIAVSNLVNAEREFEDADTVCASLFEALSMLKKIWR